MSRTVIDLKRSVKFLKLGNRPKTLEEAHLAAAQTSPDEWRGVRIPHDWAIEGDFDRENDIVYNKDGDLVYTGRTGGLPSVGTGVYRVNVQVPEARVPRCAFLEFDGVMDQSLVYVNGKIAGGNHWGYRSFCLDVTSLIAFGKENLIEIVACVKPENGRWYSGAGIFRPMRLVLTDAVHLTWGGTRVCVDAISEKSATVKIRTEFVGAPSEAKAHISDASGRIVAEGALSEGYVELTVSDPRLWSVDCPYLYSVGIVLSGKNGEVFDAQTFPFGIRKIKFDPEEGFSLNGEIMKFKGACLHHDLGLLGAAYNESAARRQLEKLREMGCNAIRTTHNPPAPQFLDLCDRMGFLVVEEFFDEWMVAKCENGYHTRFEQHAEEDIRAVIRRDANHPCVILWSIGNEIPEQLDPNGWKIAARLRDVCHAEDPTRLVTIGINRADQAVPNGFADQVDVVGWNYRCRSYQKFHKDHPEYIMFGSETESSWSSRGEYKLPAEYEHERVIREDLTVNAYEMSMNRTYTPEKEFSYQELLPFVCGQFTWTGFDYLGEPAPYDKEWPSRSAYFGIFDLAGLPKDRYWLFKSEWTDQPVLHLFPHWNWKGMEGQPIPVHCFSSFDRAELFVNGKSQGMRKKYYGFEHELEQYRFIWKEVPYEAGELRVVAYDKDGNAVAEDVRYTTGEPVKIVLTPEKESLERDTESVLFVRVSAVDEKGLECPLANNEVCFAATGAEIVGTDNGDQRDIRGLTNPCRKLYNGLCVVAVRWDGKSEKAVLTASAEGLGETVIAIPVERK